MCRRDVWDRNRLIGGFSKLAVKGRLEVWGASCKQVFVDWEGFLSIAIANLDGHEVRSYISTVGLLVFVRRRHEKNGLQEGGVIVCHGRRGRNGRHLSGEVVVVDVVIGRRGQGRIVICSRARVLSPSSVR